MSRTAHIVDSSLFEQLRLELRRGFVIVAALAALQVEQYGYSLRKRLADEGLEVDEGTLYPLLRRLEAQGLLLSEWREEGRRNKRFYRLSPSGAAMLGLLLEEWRALDGAVSGLLREFPR